MTKFDLSNQRLLPLHAPDKFVLDNFYPEGNTGLYAWIKKEVTPPSTKPLFFYLHGPVSSGKTHILSAWFNASANINPNFKMAYVSGHTLARKGASLLEGLDVCNLIAIDDIDLCCGDRSIELGLVALIEQIRNKGHSFASSASHTPGIVPFTLKDLSTRLVWGTSFGLHLLSDEGKFEALKLHMQHAGYTIPDDAILYLLNHSSRNMQDLLDILQNTCVSCLTHGKRFTTRYLKDLWNI